MTNVVMIVLDDYPTAAIYDGNGNIADAELNLFGTTLNIPNMRALAKDATFFNSMDAPVAKCMPSRVGMYTGQYPTKTRVWVNSQTGWEKFIPLDKTLAAKVRDAGFLSVGFGKLFHEPFAPQDVIDACYSTFDSPTNSAATSLEVVSVGSVSGANDEVLIVPLGIVNEGGFETYLKVTLDGTGSGIVSVEPHDYGAFNFKLAGQYLGVPTDGSDSESVSVPDTTEIQGLVVRSTTYTSYFNYPENESYPYDSDAHGYINRWADDVFVHPDAHITERAVDYLKTKDPHRRQLVQLGLRAAHVDRAPSSEFLAMHPVEDLVIPKGDMATPRTDWILRYLEAKTVDSLTNVWDPETGLNTTGDDAPTRLSLRYFFAAMEETDAYIGQIVDQLKAGDDWDDTILVIWSDHGYMHGDQAASNFDGAWGKDLPYGAAARCMCMIRHPDYGHNKTVLDPVSACDIYPTILDMLRIDRSDVDIDGKSLIPAMQATTRWFPERSPLVWRIGNVGITRRIDEVNWRIIYWFNGTWELFNETDDLMNLTNLFTDMEHRAVRTAMMHTFRIELLKLGHQTSLFGAYSNEYRVGVLPSTGDNDTYILGDPNVEIEGSGGEDQLVIQFDMSFTNVVYTIPESIEYVIVDGTYTRDMTVIGPDSGAVVWLSGGDYQYTVSGGPNTVRVGGGSNVVTLKWAADGTCEWPDFDTDKDRLNFDTASTGIHNHADVVSNCVDDENKVGVITTTGGTVTLSDRTAYQIENHPGWFLYDGVAE